MRLITLRSQIKKVCIHWKSTYLGSGNDWAKLGYYGSDKKHIYNQLMKLDLDTCTPQDVAVIIGNDSWARQHECGECDNKFDTVIEIGQEPDCESYTAYLCLDCLKKAVSLFEDQI